MMVMKLYPDNAESNEYFSLWINTRSTYTSIVNNGINEAPVIKTTNLFGSNQNNNNTFGNVTHLEFYKGSKDGVVQEQMTTLEIKCLNTDLDYFRTFHLV